MKQNYMVMPLAGNAGEDIAGARHEALNALVSAYGGATSWDAFGHWKAPSGEMVAEPVSVHAVAFEPNRDYSVKLRSIASQFARDAKQQSVYIVIDGNAEFISQDYPHIVSAQG